ncbi:MAG TPA: histidine kinase [Gaiellaceae bacterium]|nr:histidine kinase [Gaiellaceae bacterium]
MSEAILAHAGPPVRARPMAAALLLLACAATAGAIYVIAVSRIAPSPVAQSLLTALVCLTFVGTGAAALRLWPYARFGLLLAAVGFASLISVLHEANDAAGYTVGVFASNIVFAVLVHALLAYPKGRLGTNAERLIVAAAYLDVVALQAMAVIFDPLTRYHSAHPRNLALVDSRSALATGLYELEAAIAGVLALAAIVVLKRWVRAATPVARRQQLPVAIGGTIALLLFSFGLVLTPLSSHAGLIGFGLGLIAALALPGAFIATLVEGRLSGSAVGGLLVELGEGASAPGLEDALRRALGDPSLRLGRRMPDGSYRDGGGRNVSQRSPDGSVSTLVEHQGELVGMLVHDPSLRLRPQLLEAVSAAAGFALASERALETVQRVEERNRALLDAIPDPMIQVARDGTYLDVRADDHSQLLHAPEELIGRNVKDVLPHPLGEEVMAWIERTLDEGGVTSFEYEIEIDGVKRWKESRMMPNGPDEAVTILRDFTVQRHAETELRRLVEEQAALRRVATLVAGDPPPEHVFQAVTEEVAQLLGIHEAVLERFEEGDWATVVGRYGERAEEGFALGSVIPVEEGFAAWQIRRTGNPSHVETYEHFEGELAERVRSLGFRSTVAVPITVAGSIWGALIAALTENETLPPETEPRMQAFAELVGLAVSSAQAREELEASRVRIVEASDDERRRLERNLHDGAQQRLVALSVGLRLAQGKIRDAPREAEELLEMASRELAETMTELRELAQGIHPAVLTEQGLEAALEVLAARAPLPVDLDVRLPERLPEPIEATAYYVVSEALANVVKHADADSARVCAEHADVRALVEVADDGIGGADPNGGSGLGGLRDRVEALDGRLVIDSPPGRGTLVRAELPVRSRVGDTALVP